MFFPIGFPIHGGDEEIRTLDPLLAGQVLSQLSYTPVASFSFSGFWTLKIEQRLTLLTPLNFVLVSFSSVLCEMDCLVSLRILSRVIPHCDDSP